MFNCKSILPICLFSFLVSCSGEKVIAEDAVATFAGGCFWCMEKPFDETKGVKKTVSGYTGGHVKNPTYKQVSAGKSGHIEAMQVVYDPDVVDYETLLDLFWHNIDPLDGDGQFCDRGAQYRPAIFFNNREQKRLAYETSREVSELLKEPVSVDILKAEVFYPAEDYHQDYYLENPIHYKYYRYSCRRDKRLKEVWGESAGK